LLTALASAFQAAVAILVFICRALGAFIAGSGHTQRTLRCVFSFRLSQKLVNTDKERVGLVGSSVGLTQAYRITSHTYWSKRPKPTIKG